MRTHLKVATGLFVVALAFALVSPLDATMLDETKLLIPDSTGGDHFGESVGISGGVAVVGAPDHDTPASGCGSAYVFGLAGGAPDHKLTAPGAAGGDEFGMSVGVSGDVAVIGAPGADLAYLYNVTSGAYLRALAGTDTASSDAFGCSVAIDGNRAIVGAYKDDDGFSGAGSAYLFDVTTGNQLHKLTALDPGFNDYFGRSVAISGGVAIVGAAENDDAGTSSGSAYLFDVASGAQLKKLLALDAGGSDKFGCAVAISGGVAIVGAYQDDDPPMDSGSAYLFDVATGNQLDKLTADDAASTDFFGYAVAISGNLAVVGAYQDDDAGTTSGSAYLFEVSTGDQIDKMVASDGAGGDRLGFSVAVSGGRGITGAKFDDDPQSGAGTAYIFSTPEPAALTLLVLGGLGVLVRRKRKD